MELIARKAARLVETALGDTPIVVVGPRQAGKSTLARRFGLVLHLGRQAISFGDRRWAVPLSVLWT